MHMRSKWKSIEESELWYWKGVYIYLSFDLWKIDVWFRFATKMFTYNATRGKLDNLIQNVYTCNAVDLDGQNSFLLFPKEFAPGDPINNIYFFRVWFNADWQQASAKFNVEHLYAMSSNDFTGQQRVNTKPFGDCNHGWMSFLFSFWRVWMVIISASSIHSLAPNPGFGRGYRFYVTRCWFRIYDRRQLDYY